MAKYECKIHGDFDTILDQLWDGIMRESTSASYEGGSEYSIDDVRCAVRVYERYSMMGSNRLSLNLTLVGKGEDLFLSAITSGGGRTVVKSSTFGEKSFLSSVRKIAESLGGKEVTQ